MIYTSWGGESSIVGYLYHESELSRKIFSYQRDDEGVDTSFHEVVRNLGRNLIDFFERHYSIN